MSDSNLNLPERSGSGPVMSLPPSGGAKRIGVALACCNQAHFLGDAIRSILAQTHRVDEIIVVDDGSCDATRQVSTSFPEVTYHFQENGGLSSARNTGLRLCGCERILFLDADDLLKPTAIADGMARFDEVPDAAFVYGGYMEVTEYRELMFARNAVEHEDAFAGLLLGNHVSMHGTVIYNAEMLRDSGGFDTGLKSCEDYDVFLRLARRHPIAAYDSIGAEYRRHGNNMTGNHIRMMRLSREVVQRHMAIGDLTPAQRMAGKQGLDFMTGYYSRCALKEIAFCARRIRHLIWGCLKTDPKFILRALAHIGTGISRKLSRLFRKKTPVLPGD